MVFCQQSIFSNGRLPKKLIYGNYCEMEIIDKNDSLPFSSVKGYKIAFYQAKREWNLHEWFDQNDTIIRDSLIIYNHKYSIDSLILLESQYTGSYDLSYAFITQHNKYKYIILVFYDGYQLGTDQQAIFVIFKIFNNEAVFCSSYIENKKFPYSKIKLIKKKNGVFLKGKNIDKRI